MCEYTDYKGKTCKLRANYWVQTKRAGNRLVCGRHLQSTILRFLQFLDALDKVTVTQHKTNLPYYPPANGKCA